MLFHRKKTVKKEDSSYKNVTVYVDGRLSTPIGVTEACKVQEGYSYMADYVLDDAGNLREIRYDKVKDQF